MKILTIILSLLLANNVLADDVTEACSSLGRLAGKVAAARDAGVPIETAKSANEGTGKLGKIIDGVIEAGYRNNLSPELSRILAEAICMKEFSK